jgi:hypothetical protein
MYGSCPGWICKVFLVKLWFNVTIICFSLHELFIIIIIIINVVAVVVVVVVVEGIILELPRPCY